MKIRDSIFAMTSSWARTCSQITFLRRASHSETEATPPAITGTTTSVGVESAV